MDGLVDIYMPDFKFFTPESGQRYAKARDYAEVVKAAIKEMHRQVGFEELQTALVLIGHSLVRVAVAE
jgi:putative pyruvate formate lyase activating enzyme